MRIAFDLDDTLLGTYFQHENFKRQNFLLNTILETEKLRKGSLNVFEYCAKRKFEIWIYTTSYRKKWYIKALFWKYKLKLDGVVNQFVHDQHFKGTSVKCSKYPPQFGIDILIDNCKGVEKEGSRYGFKVIQIDSENENWDKILIQRLKQIK